MARHQHHVELVKQMIADHPLPEMPEFSEFHTIPKRLGMHMDSVGLEVKVELSLYVVLSVMFALFCLAVKTEKTRAWFLTALSSGLCTAAGIQGSLFVCSSGFWFTV